MSLRIISLVTLFLMSSSSYAASEKIVWGSASHYLTKYSLGLLNNYQLKPLDSDNTLNFKHIRYQLYFKNIPIWGHELILHKGDKGADLLTGVDVFGIEKDINQVTGKLTAEDVQNTIIATIDDTIIFKNTKKIIYLDSKNTAHLAYHVSLYTNNFIRFVSAPNFIIDANSSEVLKRWDDLTHLKIGQGFGGNVFVLPYRPGFFQHGSFKTGVASLGKFDVTVKGNTCFVETPEIRVINTQDTNLDKTSFPVLSWLEVLSKLSAFSYPCNEKSKYVNRNDGNTAPANFSFSSINDTMYFAGTTLDMYRKYFGIDKPLGTDLPLRAYTHIKNFDNAFAVPTIKIAGITSLHQQIVIGDGDKVLTAPAQGTIAHELSHNFTRLHSDLKYFGQSGGINEAFSDMASIAMQDYLRNDFPWYWDGSDWGIAREATLGAAPIRYMDEPEKDGHSIGNAKRYTDDLDVHESSGVFNKAFYLLANSPNWTVRKAFQVMVDANTNYWTSGTGFDAASCGVIQAAIDRKYRKKEVVNAFSEVGVFCPLTLLTS